MVAHPGRLVSRPCPRARRGQVLLALCAHRTCVGDSETYSFVGSFGSTRAVCTICVTTASGMDESAQDPAMRVRISWSNRKNKDKNVPATRVHGLGLLLSRRQEVKRSIGGEGRSHLQRIGCRCKGAFRKRKRAP